MAVPKGTVDRVTLFPVRLIGEIAISPMGLVPCACHMGAYAVSGMDYRTAIAVIVIYQKIQINFVIQLLGS